MSSNNSLEYFNDNALEYNNYTAYANTADSPDNIKPTKFLCSNREKDNSDKIQDKNDEIQLPSFWDINEINGMDCQRTPNSKDAESEDEQQELNVSQHLFNSYFNIDTENAKDDLRLHRTYLNSNRFHQPTSINLNQFRRLNYEQRNSRGHLMRQNGYHKSPHTSNPKYNNISSLEDTTRKVSTSFCSFCKKNNEP